MDWDTAGRATCSTDIATYTGAYLTVKQNSSHRYRWSCEKLQHRNCNPRSRDFGTIGLQCTPKGALTRVFGPNVSRHIRPKQLQKVLPGLLSRSVQTTRSKESQKGSTKDNLFQTLFDTRGGRETLGSQPWWPMRPQP